jgi:hypothetical protein
LTIENEQLIIEDAPTDEALTLKVCYYCGKRVPVEEPRCGTCGNDRSFTWTGETFAPPQSPAGDSSPKREP